MYLALFIITFGAFAFFGYLCFGRVLEDYHSFITTLESLFNFLLGSFSYSDLKEANPLLGPFFFMAFEWIVVIGVLCVVMSIINEALNTVKEGDEMQSNEHEIVDYIWGRFKSMLPWK
ncbi:PREDICTED: polycystic kidney disease 2-like 2 protein [Priapulus caudatus]|uniref:Polycystic kidney disease 2-like 2 protein n=1 Tax=Priapulus caudatus TaxID=37621 RepID=A0ABM1F737_PRICU|nr:PREDICTED: polycystic kidney disease 2-like 2 protein [Priapulus caudatus]